MVEEVAASQRGGEVAVVRSAGDGAAHRRGRRSSAQA
jgi:hypothetical protein